MNWTGGSRKRTIGSKFRSSKRYRQEQFFKQRREQKQRAHRPGGFSHGGRGGCRGDGGGGGGGHCAADNQQSSSVLSAATALPTSTAHCLSADLVKLGIAGFQNPKVGRSSLANVTLKHEKNLATAQPRSSGERSKKPKIAPEQRETASCAPNVATLASSIVTSTEEFNRRRSPNVNVAKEDEDTQSSPPLFLLAARTSTHSNLSPQRRSDFERHGGHGHQNDEGSEAKSQRALSCTIQRPSHRQGTSSSSSDSTMAMVSLSHKGHIRFIDNEVDRTAEVEKGMWDFSQVEKSPDTVVDGSEDQLGPERDDGAQTLTDTQASTRKESAVRAADDVQAVSVARAATLADAARSRESPRSSPLQQHPRQRLTDFEQKMLGIVELSFLGDDGSIAFMDLLLKRRACIKELPLLLRQRKLTEGFLGILQIGYNSIDAETLRSARLIEKLIKQGHHKYRPQSSPAQMDTDEAGEWRRTHHSPLASKTRIQASRRSAGSDSQEVATKHSAEAQSTWPGIDASGSPRWSDALSSDDGDSGDEAILDDPLADPLANSFRADHGLWSDSIITRNHPGLTKQQGLGRDGIDNPSAMSSQSQSEGGIDPAKHYMYRQHSSDNTGESCGDTKGNGDGDGGVCHGEHEDDVDNDADDESFDDDCMDRLQMELAQPSHVPQMKCDRLAIVSFVKGSGLESNLDTSTSSDTAPSSKQKQNDSTPIGSRENGALSDDAPAVLRFDANSASSVSGSAENLHRREVQANTNADTCCSTETTERLIASKGNLSRSLTSSACVGVGTEVKKFTQEIATTAEAVVQIADGAQPDDEG